MKIFSSTFLAFYFAQNIDCWYTLEYSQSVCLDAWALLINLAVK